jgi:hypothetical protein
MFKKILLFAVMMFSAASVVSVASGRQQLPPPSCVPPNCPQ